RVPPVPLPTAVTASRDRRPEMCSRRCRRASPSAVLQQLPKQAAPARLDDSTIGGFERQVAGADVGALRPARHETFCQVPSLSSVPALTAFRYDKRANPGDWTWGLASEDGVHVPFIGLHTGLA